MRGWWTQLYDAFEDLRFDAAEFIEAGDRVVVIVHATGRGRGSSAEVEMHLSNVWTLSGGKVLSIVTYDDRAEALEAAGLEE